MLDSAAPISGGCYLDNLHMPIWPGLPSLNAHLLRQAGGRTHGKAFPLSELARRHLVPASSWISPQEVEKSLDCPQIAPDAAVALNKIYSTLHEMEPEGGRLPHPLGAGY